MAVHHPRTRAPQCCSLPTLLNQVSSHACQYVIVPKPVLRAFDLFVCIMQPMRVRQQQFEHPRLCLGCVWVPALPKPGSGLLPTCVGSAPAARKTSSTQVCMLLSLFSWSWRSHSSPDQAMKSPVEGERLCTRERQLTRARLPIACIYVVTPFSNQAER